MCTHPNMHILEEWKKCLAYDLKLSRSQIGVCLEMKGNQDAPQLSSTNTKEYNKFIFVGFKSYHKPFNSSQHWLLHVFPALMLHIQQGGWSRLQDFAFCGLNT